MSELIKGNPAFLLLSAKVGPEDQFGYMLNRP
jgi:hypothetical protein